MKELPKISFCETKQIMPHKNLFGTSNFATNAFDVVIQLTNRNGSNAHQTTQYESEQVRSNPQTPKGDHDSENDGGANEGGNATMRQFTTGAIDEVNVNQLIEDVCSSSNDGNGINVVSDIGSGSDSNSDDNKSRETNQRVTYGESDFEDGNKRKIGDNKINLNSQQPRRKTNVMKEGQNDGNDNHDGEGSL